MVKYKKPKKRKSTSIETTFQLILQDLSLNFKREHYIGNYPVDFFLKEHNLSIEIDGCFHHACSKCYPDKKEQYPRQMFQKRRDKACIMYHKYSKINILRIKECSLVDINAIKCIILEVLSRISKGELIHECR
jgi:very-short-patch-repair endonuclease